MGVDIIAIRRNKEWIIDPENTEQLRADDILIARGAPSGIMEFRSLVEGERIQLEN